MRQASFKLTAANTPRGRRRLLANFFLALWASSLSAYTLGHQVAIVHSTDTPAYKQVADLIRTQLENSPQPKVTTFMINTAALQERGVTAVRGGTTLSVAIGVRTCEIAAALESKIPVFCVLVPRSAFEKIQRERTGDTRMLSAIFIDQPLERQVELIRVALPGKGRIGVVFGNESFDQLPLLSAAVREAGLQLRWEKVTQSDALLGALQKVLGEADVLLALPDPLVFNRDSIQGVLLTTYRYQQPLFGFAESYARAGAILALYSTPAQIAEQCAEIILRAARMRNLVLPPPQHPKYFSISINNQVARSLGIVMADEAVLRDRLKIIEPES